MVRTQAALLSCLAAGVGATAGEVNSYEGERGGSWLAGGSQWSLAHVPRYPEVAQVVNEKDVVLDGSSRSSHSVEVGGQVVVNNGGMLVIGPKECWATQTLGIATSPLQ